MDSDDEMKVCSSADDDSSLSSTPDVPEDMAYIQHIVTVDIIYPQYQNATPPEQPLPYLSYDDYGGDLKWFAQDTAQVVQELFHPRKYAKSTHGRNQPDACISALPNAQEMLELFKSCIAFPQDMKKEDIRECLFQCVYTFSDYIQSKNKQIRVKDTQRRIDTLILQDGMADMSIHQVQDVKM